MVTAVTVPMEAVLEAVVLFAQVRFHVATSIFQDHLCSPEPLRTPIFPPH